jgi:AcrR family transcriptional regulator
MKPNTPRMSSTERRAGIIAAAMTEFAESGYVGTSADTIARRVDVSQPYVLRLFGTKKELFIAVVRECFEQTGRLFEGEGGRLRRNGALEPQAILDALGEAYRTKLGDPDLLRLQLQAYAACGDPEIRAVVSEEMRKVYATVAEASGADPVALEQFFATGALINVMAVVNPPNDPGAFARWAVETFINPQQRPADESDGTQWQRQPQPG